MLGIIMRQLFLAALACTSFTSLAHAADINDLAAKHPNDKQVLVISYDDRKLVLIDREKNVTEAYPIAVARHRAAHPAGDWKIVNKRE